MSAAFSHRLTVVAAAVLLGGATVPTARAAERVTLANEAVYSCVRHDVLGTNTRLYFNADGTSYQDIPTERIASIAYVAAEAPSTAGNNTTAVPAVAALLDAPPTRGQIDVLLSGAGAAHNIDAELLASVVKIESGFRVNAKSRAGALGLMQLMPSTARENGVDDRSRADANIRGGTAYLDALLKRYHDDAVLALAAYNAGPGAVDRYHGVPPFRETRSYVYRVIREYNRRKEAQLAQAKPPEPGAPGTAR
jgi:soluble lytic murein transglycosylase-like protein